MPPLKSGPIQPLDWKQFRDRLARLKLDGGQERSTPEKDQATLEERARLLARIPAQPPRAGEVLEVLTFALGQERCALATAFVNEVQKLGDVTPLPDVPDFLMGVTNLRGQILPLFDLGKLLGTASASAGEKGKRGEQPLIIVLGKDHPEFGVVADNVFEVATMRTKEVLEAPEGLQGVAREFVQGVTAQGTLVLDGTALLAHSSFFLNQGDELRGTFEGKQA
jgi:purine-binding chemotaxis protein CheW